MEEIIRKVKDLEHLILIEPLKIDPEEFKKVGKIQAVILKRIEWKVYEIKDPSKIKIPEKGAYTLVYKPSYFAGNNETIIAAIRFYEKI